MITSWTKLKRGSHVRLACGCEGFVRSIHFERDKLSSGFLFLYTKAGCPDPKSLEEFYKTNTSLNQCFFNGNLAEYAMPAQEVAEPSWWSERREEDTNPEIIK